MGNNQSQVAKRHGDSQQDINRPSKLQSKSFVKFDASRQNHLSSTETPGSFIETSGYFDLNPPGDARHHLVGDETIDTSKKRRQRFSVFRSRDMNTSSAHSKARADVDPTLLRRPSNPDTMHPLFREPTLPIHDP
jgi:hypothetical protein